MQNNLVISKLWTDWYEVNLEIIVPALFLGYFGIHFFTIELILNVNITYYWLKFLEEVFEEWLFYGTLWGRQGSSFIWAIGIALNYYCHFLSAPKSVMSQANQDKKCNQWTISSMWDDNRNYLNEITSKWDGLHGQTRVHLFIPKFITYMNINANKLYQPLRALCDSVM